MFVDELTIKAKAGNGGDGVVRWLRLKYRPKAGPAGGNGGRGGDVYVRGVRDLSLLSKYTGTKEFKAKNGEAGRTESQHGKGSNDIYVDVPIGARVTNVETGQVFNIETENQTEKILKGGRGGLGNENFKSSTNQTPVEHTKGAEGESGTFKIELMLTADVGLIGLPNAGKSTLINLLTNSHSSIGAYPFTTTEPHLGDMFGFVIADIPGLIEGAAGGKGLGHKFLKHIQKTKMLLHLVSLESDDPIRDFEAVNKELEAFDRGLLDKVQWIVLTKSDLVSEEEAIKIQKNIDKTDNRVFIVSEKYVENIKYLQDELVKFLRTQ